MGWKLEGHHTKLFLINACTDRKQKQTAYYNNNGDQLKGDSDDAAHFTYYSQILPFFLRLLYLPKTPVAVNQANQTKNPAN